VGYKENDWMPMTYWRPNDVTDSICQRLLHYHFRMPGYRVVHAESSGPHRNETQITEPGQVSLIVGLEPGFFRCITITSNQVDRKLRWLASEYDTFRRLGQAKYWFLPAQNLFTGGYEIFNGPNVIKNLF
jgi:hypothetical protein